MKRFIILFCVTLATVCSLQAGHVNETDARKVADRYFSEKSPRLSAQPGSIATRLAYTAECDRFYVYENSGRGGFVIVAGDDRLPQVLGYGDAGDFSSASLPPAVRYWMDEMNRQIAFLQSHNEVAAHRPAKRESVVEPLLTTSWDQGAPYNNYCPTYETVNGGTNRAVTGCVATATAQVMNYYEWPVVGTGSHSYTCNVNDVTLTELSADFSQSVYHWDLMLDYYDANSSPESCDAVARLMSDVGISMDMGYGSSSGASEYAASRGLIRYFGYSDKCFWLTRDYYSAAEWDQFLVDELSERRPVMYCGYAFDGGHAFVLDGFDADGYYHVNWGWGGSYDGYFLVSLLAPTTGMNFEYGQDGLFGLVPAPRADEVDDVLYIRSGLVPVTTSVPLGSEAVFNIDQLLAEGNMLDTAGYDQMNNRKMYYALIPMSVGVFNMDGTALLNQEFSYKQYLSGFWGPSGEPLRLALPESLADGEYKVKLAYSMDEGAHYDKPVFDYSGKELYVKMLVVDGIAYLTDCFLYNTYSLESVVVPRGITIDRPFKTTVKLSYNRPWTTGDGPLGNVYLSVLKDGEPVANSELYEVMIPNNSEMTYEIEMTAPSQWGVYELVLNDESGNQMMKQDMWQGAEDVTTTIFVLPVCQELLEDFEGMTANSSTSDKNVQGNFTTWNFNKSGVRAPGEGQCNGTNAVMMKKPSTLYTAQPLSHNFFMAQATFFNPTSTLAKYKLEYSLDGSTWNLAYTIDSLEVAEVPEKSQTLATWTLELTSAQPAQFRIAMIGGGSGATYVDDFTLYYTDRSGDVNGDGEVNIADINALIDIILSGEVGNPAADVNGDGEVNIADVNALISIILAE